MKDWQTSQVLEFLKQNGMTALAPTFEENDVTGLDLLLLTEDELRSMLGLSKLQAAKVKALVDAASESEPGEAAESAAGEAAEEAAVAAAAGNDFQAGAPPAVSTREQDYGDSEADRTEMRRAVSGVEAPPPAATVPVLPTGTAALQIDHASAARFQEAVATISQLEAEGVAQALPAARSRLAAAQQQLKLQETKFEEMRAEEAKQTKKLDGLNDGKWYPGKYLFGAQRREDKIVHNKEKLDEVSNKVVAAAAQLEELNEVADSAAKRVHELATKCSSLDAARTYAATLLQSAFAGMAVGDARENALETEVVSLGPKIAEVRRYKTVYAQAYELLSASQKSLNQARQLLQNASSLATVDVMSNVVRRQPMRMRNSPGGMMVDIVKRSQMRQGVQLCHQAGDLAIKGRMMVPDMPKVDVEKLKRLRVGFGLMDVVFDNMISDIIVARKIKGMLNEVRDVQADVAYGVRWLEGWLKGRIDQDLRALDATLAQRRQELHAHRMQLMAAWIEAKARGAVQEAAPGAGRGGGGAGGVAMGVPVV